MILFNYFYNKGFTKFDIERLLYTISYTMLFSTIIFCIALPFAIPYMNHRTTLSLLIGCIPATIVAVAILSNGGLSDILCSRYEKFHLSKELQKAEKDIERLELELLRRQAYNQMLRDMNNALDLDELDIH